MIKAVFVINDQGKTRLMKFYQPCHGWKQEKIVQDIFQVLSRRDDNMCNFIDAPNLIDAKDDELIYRKYATLYFVFCVDSSENKLLILDLLQLYVETLDQYFKNVCELDLVFNFYKAYFILDEMVLGGLVLDPDKHEITAKCRDLDDIEKREVPVFYMEKH